MVNAVLDKVLYNSIIVYIIFMLVIIIIKPTSLYDRIKKSYKHFGMDENETMFPITVVCSVLSLGIYLGFMAQAFISSKLK